MLTLGRESGEYVVIGGNVVIQVVEVGNQLRLTIDAPREMTIERGENYEKAHPAPECIQRVRAKKAPPKSYGFSRPPARARAGKAEEI